ncbi:MAG TPA: porin family protein [Cyclobacteriaceae bacterium]|nr:porin family protein [Cyclobacteriaceae bacterium]
MVIKNNLLRLTLFSVLIWVGIVQVATAQMKPRAGVKGGLNASNLYVDDVDDENARIGFHLGVFGQLAASEMVALQAELLFSTRGSEAHYSSGTLQQEVKYNLNYIDLPLMVVFKVGESVEFHAGGYTSYLAGANISYEGDLANGEDEIDRDNLKSYDLGLLGGVGVTFGNVQFGARYNYGMVKLADSDAAAALLGDSKNSCAQLFVAFNLYANK